MKFLVTPFTAFASKKKNWGHFPQLTRTENSNKQNEISLELRILEKTASVESFFDLSSKSVKISCSLCKALHACTSCWARDLRRVQHAVSHCIPDHHVPETNEMLQERFNAERVTKHLHLPLDQSRSDDQVLNIWKNAINFGCTTTRIRQ